MTFSATRTPRIGLLRLVDHAHAALAELSEDAVVADTVGESLAGLGACAGVNRGQAAAMDGLGVRIRRAVRAGCVVGHGFLSGGPQIGGRSSQLRKSGFSPVT